MRTERNSAREPLDRDEPASGTQEKRGGASSIYRGRTIGCSVLETWRQKPLRDSPTPLRKSSLTSGHASRDGCQPDASIRRSGPHENIPPGLAVAGAEHHASGFSAIPT